jgi:hypothetical protein
MRSGSGSALSLIRKDSDAHHGEFAQVRIEDGNELHALDLCTLHLPTS